MCSAGEELEDWVNALINDKGVAGVSGAEVNKMVDELLSEAKTAKLAHSHWSVLRLSVSAGNILSALGEHSEAATHYIRVIDNSPDIQCHSCRHHVGMKLAKEFASAGEAGKSLTAGQKELMAKVGASLLASSLLLSAPIAYHACGIGVLDSGMAWA